MARLGWYLLVFGAGSAVLDLFGRAFVVLMWIDNRGTAAGWAIRVAMVILGAVLMLAARGQRQGAAAPGDALIR